MAERSTVDVRDHVDGVLRQWRAERPDLDVSAMGVLGRLSRLVPLLSREVATVTRSRDLGPGEFDILASLRRAGPPYRLQPGQLAAATMVSGAAVTSRVDRLVERGLVSREVDPANRRAVLVTLSDEGGALIDELLEEHVANEERLLAPLSDLERDQLAGLLRRLLVDRGDTASW